MILANFTYYKIDLADIWDFERSAFLSQEISEDEATQLLHNIQVEITKNAEAVFGIDDYDENEASFYKYYNRKEKEYRDACGSTEELFRIEFFFSNNKCYQYDYPIIIDRHHEDFDYWFALKLKQYHLKLLQLEPFLNYQLNDSFEGDKSLFDKFLTILIRQYEGSFLTKGLVDSINDWKAINQTSTPQKTISRKSTSRKMEGDIHSLQLKALIKNPKYFQSNIHGFLEAFQLLKEHDFIDASTELEQFKNIFRNKEIAHQKRIKWIGSTKELQWFIKELMYESQKIVDLKNDIWLITASCFVDKNGKEFMDSQLRNASGKRLKRKDHLVQIVQLF